MGPVAVLLAVVILLVLIATVFAVFFGVYRTMQYLTRYSVMRAPRVLMSDLYGRLKTGDLLLFVSTVHAPTNSAVTQTYYSHAGVIVREGGLVYVSEATGRSELMPHPGAPGRDLLLNGGANLSPLLTRLKYYTGVFYVAPLAAPLPPAGAEALKREAERLSREHYPYPSMWQALQAALLGREARAHHCYQHVAHLLDAGGATSGLADKGFMGVCAAVCALPGAPSGPYLPPAQILYDIDARRPPAGRLVAGAP